MALISGEAGVVNLASPKPGREVTEGPHTRLRYYCSPHHQDSALYPVIAQMERAAGFHQADQPADRLAKLKRCWRPRSRR